MPIFRALGEGIRGRISGPGLTVADHTNQFRSNFPKIFLNPNTASVLDGIENPANLIKLNNLMLGNRPLTEEYLRPQRGVLKKIQRIAKILDTAAGVSFDVIFLDGFIKLAEEKGIEEIENSGRAVKEMDELGIPYYTMKNGGGGPYREITPPQGISIYDYFPEIQISEMIDMGNYRIMKREVTVGLFKRVMEGFKFTNDNGATNAEELNKILADPSREEDVLTYVSLSDAREFARRLSELTGRRLRIPTEEEWLAARDRLSGDYWIWTETEQEDNPGQFVLRLPSYDRRDFINPEFRFYFHALCLVEDL